MVPSAKARWDEEDDDSSTPPSSPPPTAQAARRKFDDEEDEEDVADAWDEADDSEEEREKAKAAAEAKAKADAAAAANKKSKSQRIEEHRMAKMKAREAAEQEDSDESEDDFDRRQRLKAQEKEADMKNAEDLFGGVGGVPAGRTAAPKTVLANPDDPTSAIDFGKLKLFDPQTRDQFVTMRETLVPVITANHKKAQYSAFAQEFARQISRDLPSEQIKKIASSISALANEKMKEEKSADKGPKKSKAAKTKTTLNASRDTTLKADTNNYDADFGLDDGDFM